MKSVAIIVLNWNKPKLTIETVNSLLKISHKNFSYQIIIVDNGSDDDSISQFNKLYSSSANIKVISTGINEGYVSGNNFGINYALKNKFDYFLIINNDVFVKKDFLQLLVNFLEKNSQYGLVGPKIYFAPGYEFHQNRYQKNELGKVIWSAGGQIDWNNVIGSNVGVDEVDYGQFNQNNDQLDFISGCCFLIRRSVVEKIGVFENYFMYLEDVDFCLKAKQNGFKIMYYPQSVIWHLNAGSSGSGSSLHDYFLTRNRLKFGFKYTKFRTKLALFRESLRILFKSPSSWQKRGVIDFYLGVSGKGSWQ